MDLGLSLKISILENSQLHYHMHFLKVALLKYFKPTKALMVSTLSLPSGPFLEVMPLSSIEAVNKKVKSIILKSQISSENDAVSTRALIVAGNGKGYVCKIFTSKVSVAKNRSMKFFLVCGLLRCRIYK